MENYGLVLWGDGTVAPDLLSKLGTSLSVGKQIPGKDAVLLAVISVESGATLCALIDTLDRGDLHEPGSWSYELGRFATACYEAGRSKVARDTEGFCAADDFFKVR
jgi:hypothetical protein